MATMVPEVPVATTGSQAEVAVFRALQDGLPDEFFVYHSIAFHLSGQVHHSPREGEIDFLILHRELGLCALEVKGGAIAYDGRRGVWTSTTRAGEANEIRDPFKQAERGIWSIVNEIKRRKLLDGGDVPCAWSHGVVFPDCRYEPRDVPAHCGPELVIDQTRLPLIKDYVTAIMARQAGQGGKRALTTRQRKVISQQLLAPRFDLGLTLQAEFGWEERALRLLTEEQSICLDFLELNPRAVLLGSAGTGKTVIALEHARRLADQGARVLLLCFNLLLADHLRRAAGTLDGLAGSIWAGAYHELCREWTERAGIAFEVPRDTDPAAVTAFWNEESSLLLAEALEKIPERFDALIVDESQDMHELWWEVLDELLISDKASLVLLHDPEQNIYGRGGTLPLERPVFPLRVNCRCTHALGEYTAGLGGYVCRTPQFNAAGEPPVVKAYASAEEQVQLLDQRVAELVRKGVRPAQMIILGTHRLERSCLRDTPTLGGLPVTNLDVESAADEAKPAADALCYATLHRYKGLEEDVVLVCDVDGNPRSSTRRHIYVAASRAKHRLFIFADAGTLERCEWLRG